MESLANPREKLSAADLFSRLNVASSRFRRRYPPAEKHTSGAEFAGQAASRDDCVSTTHEPKPR
jgi:hypothetical protein